MSNPDFTQPPWFFSKSSAAVGVVDTGNTQSYGMLNVVAYIDRYDYPSMFLENGSLIAAAPELYEALEVLVSDSNSNQLNQEHKFIAEKALAKARGES